MFRKFKYFFGFISILNLASCGSDDSVKINFSSDSTKIIIHNLQDATIYQLKNFGDLAPLISVIQLPNDSDSLSREEELNGEVILLDKQLVFIPKSNFIKGETYQIESLVGAYFGSGKDVLKADLGTHIKPQVKILTR